LTTSQLDKQHVDKSEDNLKDQEAPQPNKPAGATGGEPPLEAAFPPEAAERPRDAGQHDMLRALRAQLLSASRGEARELEIHEHLKQVQSELEDILQDTLERGKNHTVVLIGDRGSGKTTVVKRALATAEERAEQTNPGNSRLGIVYLNGLIACDERIAFREAARQLCRICNRPFVDHLSLAENMAFMKEVLDAVGRTKVLCFVFENLETFAQRGRQTVLYNVVDTLQHQSVVGCVIGTAIRPDVDGLLEKRVQSRFTNRKILVFQPQYSGNEKPGNLLEMILRPPKPFAGTAAAEAFSRSVRESLADSRLQHLLDMVGRTGWSPHSLCNAAMSALSSMALNGRALMEASDLESAIDGMNAMERGQAQLSTQLSVLQLYLLVCLFRADSKGVDVLNFHRAFHEYCVFQRMNEDCCERFTVSTALEAFKELLETGLVNLNNEKQGSRMIEYRPVKMHLSKSELEFALKEHKSCPSILMQLLKHEAVNMHSAG